MHGRKDTAGGGHSEAQKNKAVGGIRVQVRRQAARFQPYGLEGSSTLYQRIVLRIAFSEHGQVLINAETGQVPDQRFPSPVTQLTEHLNARHSFFAICSFAAFS